MARAVIYPPDEISFVRVVDLLYRSQVPFVVLGGMSNVIAKNGFYNGVVVKTDKMQTKNVAEKQAVLSCGIRLGKTIHDLAIQGLGGMDGLCGIPGTVGGMVKQNAGAFGYCISDRFISAKCYLPSMNEIVSFNKEDMEFAYRKSILLKKQAILLSATFELLHGDSQAILANISAIRDRRKKTQPIEYPSLGSVFKRHGDTGAGYYIDKAGLKGASIGSARVSEKHAGFIINAGGATADDYLKLVDYVKSKVYLTFGIELEEEIEVI